MPLIVHSPSIPFKHPPLAHGSHSELTRCRDCRTAYLNSYPYFLFRSPPALFSPLNHWIYSCSRNRPMSISEQLIAMRLSLQSSNRSVMGEEGVVAACKSRR